MEKKKFPYGKTFIVGFGFLGISVIWPMFDQFVPLFLQAGNPEFEANLLKMGKDIPTIVGLGLTPALALFIMTWDNLINVFVQPWVGSRSDRTWNKFGRRKPWILLGVPIAAAGFIFIPAAQTTFAIAMFILITNFGMALFRSPTVSWLGDLFIPENRSKANGVINLMGGVGGLLAYVGGGLLFDKLGRFSPFIAGAIFMIFAMAVAVVLVKEPEKIEADEDNDKEIPSLIDNLKMVFNRENKGLFQILLSILLWFMGYTAISAGLSSFAVFFLGISPGKASIMSAAMTISFIIFAIPGGLIADRLGRKRTIRIGLVLMTLLMASAFILFSQVQSVALFIGLLVMGGFFWAMVNVNSLPLVYDQGVGKNIGAFTGLYYFASQIAAVAGPTLGGLLVDTLGDNYLYLWAFAGVFMLLAWFTMNGVPEKTKAEVVEN